MTSIGFFTNQSPFYCHMKRCSSLQSRRKCLSAAASQMETIITVIDNDVDDGTKDNEDDQGVNLSMVKMARTILF